MPIVGRLAYAAAEGIGVATETAVGLAVAAEGVTWLPVAYGAYKVATGDYSAHDKTVSLSDAATIKSEGISNMPDNLRGAKRQRVHLSDRIHIGHVSEAPELGHKVVDSDHQHVLPNDVDYSQSPGFPLNQEHAQRIENHKRKEREEGKKASGAKRGRLFGSEDGDDGGGDEPEDPLIQAMMI